MESDLANPDMMRGSETSVPYLDLENMRRGMDLSDSVKCLSLSDLLLTIRRCV